MPGRPGSGSRVVVVGAGASGLAAAVDLAVNGCAVTVLERAPVAGGKIQSISLRGVSVDAGPTVLTMRWVFDELFARAGARLDDYATLVPARVLARHAWPDGGRLDLFADPARTADAIGALSGPEEARAYVAFAAYCERIFEAVEEPFIRSQKPTPWSLARYAGRAGLRTVAQIDAHRTMWQALTTTFRDPRLRQLFGRYATYCGASPFTAPATLNLISHVEAAGVCRVVGGISALARAMERLGTERGVAFRYEAHVARLLVSKGVVAGVELASGEELAADAVVCSADAAASVAGLFGEPARAAVKLQASGPRSLSAVTWAGVATTSGFPLLHHNVFFSPDYVAEFAAIDGERRVAQEPTVYVCAEDRGDEADARAEERVLVIVNAPATGDEPSRWNDEERYVCETSTWRMMERCGLTVGARTMQMTTPVEFHDRFPATRGALYGGRAEGALSSLSRPGSRTKLRGLYLAGGSVHPGPGVPMAALSGRLAASSVLDDLPSIGRSRPVALGGPAPTA